MKRNILAIFAHPDDEAFGPAGTLYKLAQENNVYLLCATNGDAGEHHDKTKQRDIGKIRMQELEQSAKFLGIKHVHFLEFKDGSLCNNNYHDIAHKIEEKVIDLNADTLLTYEPRGVSGHLDHIAVSFVSRFVFNKMPQLKTLMQYCIAEKASWGMEDYFIYFPNGYTAEDVDMTIDVSDVWDKKVAAMRLHHSQRNDAEKIIKRNIPLPKEEHFFVIEK